MVMALKQQISTPLHPKPKKHTWKSMRHVGPASSWRRTLISLMAACRTQGRSLRLNLVSHEVPPTCPRVQTPSELFMGIRKADFTKLWHTISPHCSPLVGASANLLTNLRRHVMDMAPFR